MKLKLTLKLGVEGQAGRFPGNKWPLDQRSWLLSSPHNAYLLKDHSEVTPYQNPPPVHPPRMSSSIADQEDHYIGVDVGTGSVRASLINRSGKVIAAASQETKTWRDLTNSNIFEQSTSDIWSATGVVIKKCLTSSGLDPRAVKGIGFDATCSLAVTDFDGAPVVVTKGDKLGHHGERNVILWADHRAEKEANLINGTGSIVLDYVGGKMSVCTYFPEIIVHEADREC